MGCIPDQSTGPLQYNLSRRVGRIVAKDLMKHHCRRTGARFRDD
jgi:hypothetical protein